MRPRLGVLPTLVTALVVVAPGLAHAAPEDRVMTPIGGGYELPTLEEFARTAGEGASGPTIDLVVVPSAYGDAPEDRAENLELAQERTDQVGEACEAVVRAPYTGCTATLAVLLDRDDALDPANAEALADPDTDGIYLLGGDQGLAMQVLADTPAEAAMQQASDTGALVGGTSAGAAVESLSMINGYVGDLGPEDGLRQGSTLMWWGDDGPGDPERGLSFGSTAAIYDQHFHQRGRLGRTLSTLATAEERGGGSSPVGVGVDYATGLRNTGDLMLSGVFGQGSATIVDYDTLDASHTWVGEPAVLSARGVLTHLLTTGSSYDLRTRTYRRHGQDLANPVDRPWTPPRVASDETLVLGGGDVPAQGVAEPVAAARARGLTGGRIIVVSVGSRRDAAPYAEAVREAGWRRPVDTVGYGGRTAPGLGRARAVLVVADDPVLLGEQLAGRGFRSWVRQLVAGARPLLTDGAMTAALGDRWSANRRPTDSTDREELSIASYQAGDAQFQRGLGIVDATLVPWLNTDFGWGRLYEGVSGDPDTLAVGVAAGSSVTVTEGAGTTGGSVVVADGRGGSYWTAHNGAIGASGVVLDVFGPGEELVP